MSIKQEINPITPFSLFPLTADVVEKYVQETQNEPFELRSEKIQDLKRQLPGFAEWEKEYQRGFSFTEGWFWVLGLVIKEEEHKGIKLQDMNKRKRDTFRRSTPLINDLRRRDYDNDFDELIRTELEEIKPQAGPEFVEAIIQIRELRGLDFLYGALVAYHAAKFVSKPPVRKQLTFFSVS